jgi:DNA repair protein RadA/Sms
MNDIIYECNVCGNLSKKWIGFCKNCENWNSFIEKREINKKNKIIESDYEVVNLSSVKKEDLLQYPTNVDFLDKVLEGGYVKGQVILLSGNPGIGKSTLLLQLASLINKRVLYIAGEETKEQIALRAMRLGVNINNIDILATPNVDVAVQEPGYDIYIYDSLQTLLLSDTSYSRISNNYLSEATDKIIKHTKSNQVLSVIVGQITKEGNIAGPKAIEHMVDTVLYLQGERDNSIRLLKVIKNRFGSDNEISILKMNDKGLYTEENKNIFLNTNVELLGNADTIIMEGRKPIAISIQSLTSKTIFGYPKRSADGYSNSRLNLISAVLEKYLNLNLQSQDIYLNVVAGINVKDPAADLAVCASILSSYKNKFLKKQVLFIGEIGLSGEVRDVNNIKKRIAEGKALGYKEIITYEKLKNIKQLNQYLI